MRKEPKYISAGELRRAFAPLALHLETTALMHEAETLKLKVRVAKGSRTSILKIQLTHAHTMRISPVDRGANGVSEFYTFYGNPENPSEIRSSIRVYVEITDNAAADKPIVQESFTVQGDDLEEVIKTALSVYFNITGHKLMPEFEGRRK